MFGWRRRSEGFEWQEYVRTTILVRRADRQRRVDDARLAALAKVQHAKDKGLEAGKAGLDLAADKAARAAKATGRTLSEFALAAVIGFGRYLKSGYDVAVKIITPYLPERKEPPAKTERPVHERFAAKRDPRAGLRRDQYGEQRAAARETPLLPDIGPNARKAIGYAMRATAAVAVILVAGRMLQSGGELETGSVTRTAAVVAESIDLAGRATALTGDALRLSGKIVRLAGITAPEDNQPCFTAKGKRWSCSAFARKALDRMVRRSRVACTPSGTDDAGITLATCTIDGEDLAQVLARAGHVFAETGLFASYRAEEDAAREEKAGVWQGETVRPEEWRTRVWEEAKRTAPDGCPIRGVVRSGENVYAMPWSSEYGGSHFSAARGDRWFCSEQEARDAGFKPALRS